MFAAFSDIVFGDKQGQISNNKENRGSNVNVSRRSTTKRKSESDVSSELQNRLYDLENEVTMKDSMIEALTSRLSHFEDEYANMNQMITDSEGTSPAMGSKAGVPGKFGREKSMGGGNIVHRQHVMPTSSHCVDNDEVNEMRLGTRESLLTQRILQSAEKSVKTEGELIAEKFIKIFDNYMGEMQYLHSKEFAHDLSKMCEEVETLLENEPRCVFLQSPVYIFGDIHGNVDDLRFFAENIWKMGMGLTAGKFLFLGDYVDRGMMGLECVAYLFAQKLLHPHKIILLRGNHETRDVNGWEEHYAEKAFVRQCKDRFGQQLGVQVWEECNQAFDRLPMAAVVDHDMFCVHGGIPRMPGHFSTEIQTIMALPNVAAVMPSYEHEDEWMKQVAGDCIWSDPAGQDSGIELDEEGFGDSPRGGGAICFGTKAIENFLQRNNLSYVVRAHEAHSQGVSLSNGARYVFQQNSAINVVRTQSNPFYYSFLLPLNRLFTVFSTSKDHRQGHGAMAGCILVDNYVIQVITRSPKYENNAKIFGRQRSRSSMLMQPNNSNNHK